MDTIKSQMNLVRKPQPILNMTKKQPTAPPPRVSPRSMALNKIKKLT